MLATVSAVRFQGRIIWIADAHRGDGSRFVVHADKRLTAFLNSIADSPLRHMRPHPTGNSGVG